jgi:hypothetical protein
MEAQNGSGRCPEMRQGDLNLNWLPAVWARNLTSRGKKSASLSCSGVFNPSWTPRGKTWRAAQLRCESLLCLWGIHRQCMRWGLWQPSSLVGNLSSQKWDQPASPCWPLVPRESFLNMLALWLILDEPAVRSASCSRNPLGAPLWTWPSFLPPCLFSSTCSFSFGFLCPLP